MNNRQLNKSAGNDDYRKQSNEKIFDDDRELKVAATVVMKQTPKNVNGSGAINDPPLNVGIVTKGNK